MSRDEDEMPPPVAKGAGRCPRRGSRAGAAAAMEGPPEPPLAVAPNRGNLSDAGKADSRASRESGHVDLALFDSDRDVEEDSVDDGDEEIEDDHSDTEEEEEDEEEDEKEDSDETEDDSDDGVDEDDDSGESSGSRSDLGMFDDVVILMELNAMPPGTLRLQRMGVKLGHNPAMGGGDPYWQPVYRREFPGLFPVFVTELERCQVVVKVELEYANFAQPGWEVRQDGSNGRGIWDADAEDADNGDDDGDEYRIDLALLPEVDDFERLFGHVLPHHASMTDLAVKAKSILQPRFLNSFAESATLHPAFSLQSLTIVATPLDAECSRILKTMLQHNVRLRELSLRRYGLDADGWRLVCEGAAANRHLDLLDLKDNIELPTGTVLAALGSPSTLSKIHVAPRIWTRRAFGEIVQALRVNAALTEVFLAQRCGFQPAPAVVLDLLRTYNFTLRSVRVVHGKDGTPTHEGPIEDMLRRNDGVRRTVEHLGASNYRVPRLAAWPLALQELVTIPTLLYRFVRRGNVDAFAEQVVVVRASASMRLPRKGKRSREQLQDSSSDA